jgi:hypothetical protein
MLEAVLPTPALTSAQACRPAPNAASAPGVPQKADAWKHTRYRCGLVWACLDHVLPINFHNASPSCFSSGQVLSGN